MKPARLLLLFSLMLTTGLAAADPAAIDRAGQQRMLSQRIVKSWCQIGLNVQPERSKAQLDEAVKRFESNLQALASAAGSPEAGNALAGLKAAWTPLRQALGGEVRQADAAQLDARGEDVLMAAERLTRILENQAREPASRWINLAGRQRMLSQRLVKIYMLQQWGVTSPAQSSELDRIQSEFAGALATLQANAADPALRAELEKLALQWEWLHATLALEGAASFRLIMAEGGDAVLQLAEQVLRLYAQPAPQPASSSLRE